MRLRVVLLPLVSLIPCGDAFGDILGTGFFNHDFAVDVLARLIIGALVGLDVMQHPQDVL